MTASETRPVAVDAMGGDNAPAEIVRGALQAVYELQIPVMLVGRRDVIERELKATSGPESSARGRIEIDDAADVIAMDEHPAAAVRQKKDASIVRTCELVAQGKACAAVSAGNSGALLAAALFAMKRIPGVDRPAIGAQFPTRKEPVFMLDAGANTDCKPEWLLQFAVMGSVFSGIMMGRANPRVAMLSNGEEESKGSQAVQESASLLRQSGLNFVGNIEGKTLFSGSADVVVTDGFVGNVALKTAEGVGEFLFTLIRDEAKRSWTGKLGGALLRPRLQGVRRLFDYRQTGGALLLGVQGEVIVAHGRSDALAIRNAIRVARQAADAGVSGKIAGALSEYRAQGTAVRHAEEVSS